MTTGFIFDETFLLHQTGAGHPESAARLSLVMDYLKTLPLYETLTLYPTRAADRELVESNHSAAYLSRAEQACATGESFLDSMDVSISEKSYHTALQAVGAAVSLADGVIKGDLDNGFALARPPGHHAEYDQAMGFCLFNNVAIVARHLQARHGIGKALILDWDVHHGNGTQHSFEDDPSVLYISAHQYPFYPGTGAYWETGVGRGKGATLNCPMSAGSDDAKYEAAFMEKILPKIDEFKPEFVIISAGFDAHQDDPLGQINLSASFYGWMTTRMMEMADQHAQGRLVSVLEGGYNLEVLPLCVEEHLRALSSPA